MAKLDPKKKFVTLDDARVSYKPKDDSIHITSTDKDLNSEGLHLRIGKNSKAEKTLRELLKSNELIRESTSSDENEDKPNFNDLKIDSEEVLHSTSIHGTRHIYLGKQYNNNSQKTQWSLDKNAIMFGEPSKEQRVVMNNIVMQAIVHKLDLWMFTKDDSESSVLANYSATKAFSASGLDEILDKIEALDEKSSYAKSLKHIVIFDNSIDLLLPEEGDLETAATNKKNALQKIATMMYSKAEGVKFLFVLNDEKKRDELTNVLRRCSYFIRTDNNFKVDYSVLSLDYNIYLDKRIIGKNEIMTFEKNTASLSSIPKFHFDDVDDYIFTHPQTDPVRFNELVENRVN